MENQPPVTFGPLVTHSTETDSIGVDRVNSATPVPREPRGASPHVDVEMMCSATYAANLCSVAPDRSFENAPGEDEYINFNVALRMHDEAVAAARAAALAAQAPTSPQEDLQNEDPAPDWDESVADDEEPALDIEPPCVSPIGLPTPPVPHIVPPTAENLELILGTQREPHRANAGGGTASFGGHLSPQTGDARTGPAISSLSSQHLSTRPFFIRRKAFQGMRNALSIIRHAREGGLILDGRLDCERKFTELQKNYVCMTGLSHKDLKLARVQLGHLGFHVVAAVSTRQNRQFVRLAGNSKNERLRLLRRRVLAILDTHGRQERLVALSIPKLDEDTLRDMIHVKEVRAGEETYLVRREDLLSGTIYGAIRRLTDACRGVFKFKTVLAVIAPIPDFSSCHSRA